MLNNGGTLGYGNLRSLKMAPFVILCRVTTCLENLEMSGNLTAVRDFTKSQGKNLVREK